MKHAMLTAIDDHLTNQPPDQIAASCDAETATTLVTSTDVTKVNDNALTYRGVAMLVGDELQWRVAWAGGDLIAKLEPYNA